MKILHLNTYAGNGGAGKACLRLSRALQKQNLSSEVAVNFLFTSNPQVNNLSESFFVKWLTAAEIISERLLNKLFTKRLPIPFSIPLWGKDLSKNELLRSSDIIHIHWINHAFLTPAHVAKLAKWNKPIVWTFHDSNAFTGGCHVRYTCDHFQKECGNCPLLIKPSPGDLSHRIWKQKKLAYADVEFTVVAPSQWMARSVLSSGMLGSKPIVNIPNTLDTEIFKPVSSKDARKKFGIASDKFILMSGFMPSRKDLHKGTSYLIDALDIFAKENKQEIQHVELVIFGNRDTADVPDFPVKTTFLGTITEEEQLALCYNSADVFLAPSLEDNLPYTVMESLACGTPVVAFTVGGIPDMVQHQVTGYLAKYRSSEDLAAGISWLFKHSQRELLRSNARKFVLENFSERKVAQQHIQVYQSLLDDHVSA